MSIKGFTGISFPFRIGVKGGVVMSTTDEREVKHIIEAMEQILLTRPNERGMEFNFKSDLDTDIFEPADISTATLLEFQIKEALSELEDRIEVNSVTVEAQDNTIVAEINFTVLAYETEHSTQIKVGELNVPFRI